MAAYTVYTQYLSTKYKSTVCSKSTLFLWFITFWTFFFPLLFAYRSQGFWVKELSYREQPAIRFKQKYFLLLETDRESEPIICTSLLRLSDDLEDYNHCTSIKTNEFDHDSDGKLDSLIIEVDANLPDGVYVKSIYFVIVFDYILQHQCLLQMECLGIIQSTVSLPTSKFQYVGDLRFVQRNLLPCSGRDLQYNYTMLPDDEAVDFNIDDVVSTYIQRPTTTKLENEYSSWTRRSDTQSFSIQAQVNYSKMTIQYRPGFWPVMKWAWVQYLSILMIFLTFFRWIKGYVFLNHLLPSVPENPWQKMKLQ